MRNSRNHLLLWILLVGFCYRGELADAAPPKITVPGGTPRFWVLKENTPVGAPIARYGATVDPGKPKVFSLRAEGGDVRVLEFFHMNEKTGQVTLKSPLDYQNYSSFTVVPTVFDGDMPAGVQTPVRVVPFDTPDDPEATEPGMLFPLPPPSNSFTRSPPVPLLTGPNLLAPTVTDPTPFTAGTVPSKPIPTSETVSDHPNTVKEVLLDLPSLGLRPTNFNGTRSKLDNGAVVPVESCPNCQYAWFAVIPVIGIGAAICMWIANVRRRKRSLKRKNPLSITLSAETGQTSCRADENLGFKSDSMTKEPLKMCISNNRYLCRRKSSNGIINGNDGYLHPTMPEENWEFPRENINIQELVGEGCFGQVFKAVAMEPSGITSIVAVKTLKEHAAEKEKRDLLSELHVMKSLEYHPNVVQLLGCCAEEDPIFVIMEYVALGKLQSFLRRSRNSHYYGNLNGDSVVLNAQDLTSFGFQVARGMQYLSSRGILHRDLAARNVLVDQDRVCKVSDFGLARDVIDNHIYERKSEGRLPIRWMAPESLFDNLFTTKTDVWSFGILLWEIVTLGSTPYPGMAAAEVLKKIREGYRPERPSHCKRELYNIMFYCWHENPEERPFFTELVERLGELLHADQDYLDLNNFPENSYYNTIMTNVSGEKV